ncbi:MAG: hypothetical protein NZ480_04960 [Bdellovibrionaceae bacterium]|nr:hypothetical protein [Pseudobdellovibrionaceae bacterium]MDW8191016.1 hypothetical protein [Pseudobdellovibrionaceae bacterium]
MITNIELKRWCRYLVVLFSSITLIFARDIGAQVAGDRSPQLTHVDIVKSILEKRLPSNDEIEEMKRFFNEQGGNIFFNLRNLNNKSFSSLSDEAQAYRKEFKNLLSSMSDVAKNRADYVKYVLAIVLLLDENISTFPDKVIIGNFQSTDYSRHKMTAQALLFRYASKLLNKYSNEIAKTSAENVLNNWSNYSITLRLIRILVDLSSEILFNPIQAYFVRSAAVLYMAELNNLPNRKEYVNTIKLIDGALKNDQYIYSKPSPNLLIEQHDVLKLLSFPWKEIREPSRRKQWWVTQQSDAQSLLNVYFDEMHNLQLTYRTLLKGL